MSRDKWKTKSLRETEKMLRANGYSRIGYRGDHFKYTNGTRTIIISGSCNKMYMRRLVKEYGLQEVQ